MKIEYSVIVFPLLVSLSCSSPKHSPAFYDPDSPALDSPAIAKSFSKSLSTYSGDKLIIIPFEESDGMKHVKASVHGRNLDMIFNTECSRSIISVAEANYLYQKGYLIEEEIMGTPSLTETGKIEENMVFSLKEVTIDGKITCSNIDVTVSANADAPLLLCSDAIDSIGSYIVDNERREICFKLN